MRFFDALPLLPFLLFIVPTTSALPKPSINSEHALFQHQGGLISLNGTTSDGYYYTFSTEPNSNAAFTSENGGMYGLQWSTGDGYASGGIGWNPGSSKRIVNYNGTYSTNGNSMVSVYGWTRSPLVQYYIVESFGTLNPSSAAQRKGTVTCDGAEYLVAATTRYNQPSIDGTLGTFAQYWSVRVPKKPFFNGPISGTVDVKCHFDAWKSFGMNLGLHDYQIFATEAYYRSGFVRFNVA